MILRRLEFVGGRDTEQILTPEQRSRILELWQIDLWDEEYLASE